MKLSEIKDPIERIKICLESIGNLHPTLFDKLLIELQSSSLISNMGSLRSYVVKLLKIPTQGKGTINYWLARGWSKQEAYYKRQQYHKNRTTKRLSPYSREFWLCKINPNTGKNYTVDEADYERNSRRPIRKEYWMARGFSEIESTKKAIDTAKTNTLKGRKSGTDPEIKRVNNRLCLEYWLLRGYSEEESKSIISNSQKTFSLKICIEKYGEERGREVWSNRQEKWQTTLNKKSDEEINEINKKKNPYRLERFKNKDEYLKTITTKYDDVHLNEDDFIKSIKKDLDENAHKKCWSPQKYASSVPQYQLNVLNLTETDLTNIISDFFVEDVYLLENSGAYKNYIKWVDNKLLRSSYEIYFYDKICELDKNLILDIDGRYPNSKLKYDFRMLNNDIIEICPICSYKIKNKKTIEYIKRLEKKIKLFNPIILKTEKDIDNYVKNYGNSIRNID